MRVAGEEETGCLIPLQAEAFLLSLLVSQNKIHRPLRSAFWMSKIANVQPSLQGRSIGSLQGEFSTPEEKTYPRIAIRGYSGDAIVVVSCVTGEKPYKVTCAPARSFLSNSTTHSNSL